MFRILIVDDFLAWRREVVQELAKNPEFEIVGEASDGLEAIKKYAALHPDVVLLDIGMPGINGLEAARQILLDSPDARIVFWSEYSDRQVVHAAFQLGAKAYIAKSEAAGDLMPALEAVLHELIFVSKVLGAPPAPSTPIV